MQQENIDDAKRRFEGREITTIPLFKQEVRGREMLERLAREMDG